MLTLDPRRGPPRRLRGGLARRDRRRPRPSARAPIEAAAARVAAAVAGNAPVYGVNTGFGKLASVKIDARRHRAAPAQPHPVALRRRRRADRPRRSSA